MRWAGHVACMGERGGAHRVSEGNPEGRRSIGRPRRRWEDNSEMDVMGGMDWLDLAQNRDRLRVRVNAVMNLRVP